MPFKKTRTWLAKVLLRAIKARKLVLRFRDHADGRGWVGETQRVAERTHGVVVATKSQAPLQYRTSGEKPGLSRFGVSGAALACDRWRKNGPEHTGVCLPICEKILALV